MSKLLLRASFIFMFASALCFGIAPAYASTTPDQPAPIQEEQDGTLSAQSDDASLQVQAIEDTADEACLYDEKKAATLTENLEKRFSKDGEDASIDSTTYAAAIALGDLGLSANISTDEIIANLAKEISISSGRLGKYITALTAAGVDCTKVKIDGKERDLIKEMEELIQKENENPYGGMNSVYNTVCVLPVYGGNGYKANTAGLEDGLVDSILEAQLKEGDYEGLFASDGFWGTQVTAQAILALQPYEAKKIVAEALKAATERLFAMQNPNGSWCDSDWDTDPRGNVEATAWVIAALNAMGIDCTGKDARVVTANGSTPMGFLLAAANKELNGFTEGEYNVYSEPMASASVLMSLAAQENETILDGPYNVYTGPLAVDKKEPVKQTSVTAKSPKTSDDSALLLGAFVTSLTAALVGMFTHLRRRQLTNK